MGQEELEVMTLFLTSLNKTEEEMPQVKANMKILWQE